MPAFLLALFAGLLLRILLIGNPGFVADESFWKSWSMAASDHGIVWTAHNTNINYPPGFIYVLWFMGKLYSFIGDPHDYNTFWRENNFGFLLASKSVGIIADIAVALLLFWFFSQKDKLRKLGASLLTTDDGGDKPVRSLGNKIIAFSKANLPFLLASIFFLNPIVIIDSALWGQVESYGILFTLVAIILIFYGRPVLASAIFTVGCLMKLQNIIYIPLFYLFIFRYYDLKTVIRSLASSALAFFVVSLPFIMANDLKEVLYLMTVNNDYFPWLSLNAHNLWWIVAGAKGMQVTDKITIWGILNAKMFGNILFASTYLLSAILIFRKPQPRNLLIGLTAGIFAFYLFMTESHERYSYPVIVFLLLFYPFLGNTVNIKISSVEYPLTTGNILKKIKNYLLILFSVMTNKAVELSRQVTEKIKKNKEVNHIDRWVIYFWIIYILFTVNIFFNIHMGLILNYPYNGFNSLTKISTLPMSILNSYVSIAMYLLLMPFILTQISKWYVAVCAGVFLAGVLGMNASFLLGKPLSLTVFKPVLMKQDYGVVQYNMSVNAYNGWKSWSRLSDDYMYYRKGFGSHANSNLVFDINRNFSRFTTDFGVDTEAPTAASVQYKIYGDGKELFSTTKNLGRFDFPGHAEVNISGVKYLGLVITDGGDGINSDHADWFNPVLYR